MSREQQTASTARKLLLVKHSKGWDVDRVNCWAERRGHQIERCFPADGDTLPNPANYDGVVVFGGAMSANDCRVQPWMLGEMSFIDDCIECQSKFFGICLGAQLLARVLGAKVSEPNCGSKEVGFYPLTPAKGSDFIQPGTTMFQWHGEGFELPSGATLLASSDIFCQQAFSVDGGHYGVQFHPEVNPDVLALWQARIPADKHPWLTPELRQQHMEQCKESDARITTWMDDFLDNWLTTAV